MPNKSKAAEAYASAKKTAKEQDEKASHLSSRSVRETHGVGFYVSKKESEAAEYSRKRRVAMADAEVDYANVRAAQARKKMNEDAASGKIRLTTQDKKY